MSCELCLRNRQRLCRINLRQLREIVETTLHEHLGVTKYELGVHLVAAPTMTRVNEAFLQHAGSTDVITFDYTPVAPLTGRRNSKARRFPSPAALHGEMFICLDEAVAQAKRFRTTWQSEVVRYILHGLLHLVGFDDKGPLARRNMKQVENRLLRRVAHRFVLSEL